MQTLLNALTATALHRNLLRFGSSILVSACAAVFLDNNRYGQLGGVIAFLVMVAVSWLTGPGPASLTSLSLMLTARSAERGFQSLASGYTSQELINLGVFTIIMVIVGWAGKIRRKSLNEVRKRELLLREQSLRKDQFLATLAHELRNPLAPLRNGLEVLHLCSGPNYDPVTFSEIHAVMTRQLDHMVRLVDDLMDVGRINTGKIALQKEWLCVNQLLEDAVDLTRPHIQAGRHTLTVVPTAKGCKIHGDRARLIQVLANLLNNAAKFTPESGNIRIEAVTEDGRLSIAIRDSGIGLSTESLRKVFEMFAQVDQAKTRQRDGLGIGLNLALRLVELHGGTIDARSDGLGKGSEFVVRLPGVQRDNG